MVCTHGCAHVFCVSECARAQKCLVKRAQWILQRMVSMLYLPKEIHFYNWYSKAGYKLETVKSQLLQQIQN